MMNEMMVTKIKTIEMWMTKNCDNNYNDEDDDDKDDEDDEDDHDEYGDDKDDDDKDDDDEDDDDEDDDDEDDDDEDDDKKVMITKMMVTKIIMTEMMMTTYLRIMFSMAVGRVGTFQGMFAFQQRQASERCCRMTLALFCLTPCGIMSTISSMTEARSSRS